MYGGRQRRTQSLLSPHSRRPSVQLLQSIGISNKDYRYLHDLDEQQDDAEEHWHRRLAGVIRRSCAPILDCNRAPRRSSHHERRCSSSASIRGVVDARALSCPSRQHTPDPRGVTAAAEDDDALFSLRRRLILGCRRRPSRSISAASRRAVLSAALCFSASLSSSSEERVDSAVNRRCVSFRTTLPLIDLGLSPYIGCKTYRSWLIVAEENKQRPTDIQWCARIVCLGAWSSSRRLPGWLRRPARRTVRPTVRPLSDHCAARRRRRALHLFMSQRRRRYPPASDCAL
uniref:Uncharacterized protein n=1 Tax=Plectus sambesii TaxID=2011161 RepID=A0A914VBW9_9BILA